MSLPEVSTPELILQYTAAKKHVEQLLVETHGERTPNVLHVENVALRLLVQLKDREIADAKDKQADDILLTSIQDRENADLKRELKTKQDEILRLMGILEERKWVEKSRSMWRDRCGRAEKAIRKANMMRDEYYKAWCDATSHLEIQAPPPPEELRKTFGEPELKRAGKLTWSNKWP